MGDPPYCRHCHVVIGVYEPLIVLANGRARETSRAAGEHPDDSASECYHRDCYERLTHEGAPDTL